MSIFAIPALALVGFELAFATHTIGAGASAGLLAVWLFDIEVQRSGSLVLGIALGLIYSWAFRFVPLLRWDLWRVGWRYLPRDATGALVDDPTGAARVPVFIHDRRTTLYALAVALVWLGGVLVSIAATTGAQLLAFLLIALGVSSALYIAFLWFTSDTPSSWLTLTTAVIITALLAATLINTGETPDSVLRQLLLQAALFFLAVLGAILQLRIYWSANAAQRQLFADDVRAAPSQCSATSVALRWFFVWLIPAVLYAATGIALAVSDSDAVLPTVVVTAVVLGLVGIGFGAYYWWRIEAYAHYSFWTVDDLVVVGRSAEVREFDEEARPLQQQQQATSSAAQLAPASTPMRQRPAHQLARHVATPSALSAMAVKKN